MWQRIGVQFGGVAQVGIQFGGEAEHRRSIWGWGEGPTMLETLVKTKLARIFKTWRKAKQELLRTKKNTGKKLRSLMRRTPDLWCSQKKKSSLAGS